MKPKFSILIPSIPSRLERFLIPLYRRLESQADDRVEILSLLDNKKRSIGLKRDALVQAAQGDYLAFVDDDDGVSDDYVQSILEAIEANAGVDVIVFNQISQINNGNPFVVHFGLEYQNEEAKFLNGEWMDIKRKPFHVCVWRTELAQRHRFPDASYGEDWHWADRVLTETQTQYRIHRVLHYYNYRDNITEAELTFPQ